MDYALFNPNVVPLLQGIKPFVKGNREKLISGALGVIDMLSSTYGQNALKALTDLFYSEGHGSDTFDKTQPLEPSISFGIGLAFALFLILILLIICCVLLVTGWSDSPANEGDDLVINQ